MQFAINWTIRNSYLKSYYNRKKRSCKYFTRLRKSIKVANIQKLKKNLTLLSTAEGTSFSVDRRASASILTGASLPSRTTSSLLMFIPRNAIWEFQPKTQAKALSLSHLSPNIFKQQSIKFFQTVFRGARSGKKRQRPTSCFKRSVWGKAWG